MKEIDKLRGLASHEEGKRCAAQTIEALIGNSCSDYRRRCGDCRRDADEAINALADRIERERDEHKGRIESLESQLRMLAVNGNPAVDAIALADLARDLRTRTSLDPDGDNRVAERILKALTYAPPA